MKVVYIGPHDEVEVPYIEDGIEKKLTAKRGEAVDVPDELANGNPGTVQEVHGLKFSTGFGGLLEQADNWKKAGSKAPVGARDDA